MASQPQDDFKPIAPPGGRDWLTNGFGIYRCICERCAPRHECALAQQYGTNNPASVGQGLPPSPDGSAAGVSPVAPAATPHNRSDLEAPNCCLVPAGATT